MKRITAVPTKLYDRNRLWDSEEVVRFFENVFQAATEYSVICASLDGSILLWNEGARRLYGYEGEEVAGKAKTSLLDGLEAHEREFDSRIRAIALRDGKWEGKATRTCRDGHRFIASVAVTTCKDQAGLPVAFLLISRDISDQVHLSEAFSNSGEKLRVVLESEHGAMVIVNQRGELMVYLLEAFGYLAYSAHDGEEGLAAAAPNPPDLILSGTRILYGDGFELLECLKADRQFATTPCVLITSAEKEKPDRAKAAALGAIRFLIRPFEPQAVLAEIAVCLGERTLHG